MKPFREGYIQFRSIRKMMGLVKLIKCNNYMDMYRTNVLQRTDLIIKWKPEYHHPPLIRPFLDDFNLEAQDDSAAPQAQPSIIDGRNACSLLDNCYYLAYKPYCICRYYLEKLKSLKSLTNRIAVTTSVITESYEPVIWKLPAVQVPGTPDLGEDVDAHTCALLQDKPDMGC
jgi:hypothetical protein